MFYRGVQLRCARGTGAIVLSLSTVYCEGTRRRDQSGAILGKSSQVFIFSEYTFD